MRAPTPVRQRVWTISQTFPARPECADHHGRGPNSLDDLRRRGDVEAAGAAGDHESVVVPGNGSLGGAAGGGRSLAIGAPALHQQGQNDDQAQRDGAVALAQQEEVTGRERTDEIQQLVGEESDDEDLGGARRGRGIGCPILSPDLPRGHLVSPGLPRGHLVAPSSRSNRSCMRLAAAVHMPLSSKKRMAPMW